MDWIIVLYILIAVFLVSAMSLVGIFTFFMKQSGKRLIMYFVSFSVGALLGDIFIHLLPEAFEKPSMMIGVYVICGMLFSFIIEKFIHWRHCHIEESKQHHHAFAYMNLVGDSFHNFIDGLVIAGSFFISVPVGIATTIAVLLHEIPQELGDFAILIHGGFSKAKALLFNFLTALTAVLGAIIGIILGSNEQLLVFLIPFAAGNLLYIAAADLIPELHKDTCETDGGKNSLYQIAMIVLGIGIMLLLLLLE